MATSSAINKKITLQSTSATNVASVAFAIQHKDKIIITFYPFLLSTTNSYIVIVGIVNCIVDTLVIPIDSCKVFQHYYSILHTITYSIRNNQHNIDIFTIISNYLREFLIILQLSLLIIYIVIVDFYQCYGYNILLMYVFIGFNTNVTQVLT